MSSKKINFWIMSTFNSAEKKFYKKIFKDFKLEFKADVQINRVSWSKAYSELVRSFKNNEAPDVFQLGTTWINTFAHLGYLAPKPEFVSRKAITDWLHQRCCYRENTVAVPWNIAVKALLVHKKNFEKMDISLSDLKNRDYFYSICHRIKENRIVNSNFPFGVTFPLKTNKTTLHIFTAWLFATGGTFPDLKKKPIPEKILRSPDCINNFRSIIKLLKTTAQKKEYTKFKKHMYEVYKEFEQGKQLFYLGDWQLRSQNEDWEERPYSILPIPAPEGENIHNKGGGSVLCVSSTSSSPNLSWELVKKITSDKYLDLWMEITGRLPAFQTNMWNKRFDEKMVQKAYENILKSNGYPCHPLWGKIEDVLNEGITNYIWKILNSSSPGAKINEQHPILKKADRQAARILQYSWDFPHTK